MTGRKARGLRRTAQGRRMMLAMSAAALTGCASVPAGSGTERTVCRELRADLPTYSTADTAETLASGARFLDVFEAVCD